MPSVTGAGLRLANPEKEKGSGSFEASGANFGGGRSPRALSRRHTLGRSRFRGRCASRRHSPRHADVSVSWRDRPDRYRSGSLSEASSPGSDAPCRERRAGRGADTPAIFILRVGTVTAGTAPAFGRSLAPRYGSDLLPLRLHSLLQRGDHVLRGRPSEEVRGLCLGPLAPRRRDSLARPARAASGAFWRGRPAGNRDCVLVCAVATKTLWGNCVGARVETPRGPDSAQRGF